MTATTTTGPRHSAKARPSWNQFILSWQRRGDEIRNDQLITGFVGLGSAVMGVSVAAFGRGTAAAVWVGLVTLCVTPGCTFVCWHMTRDRLTRVLAVLAVSLTWTVLVATLFAWLQITNLGVFLATTAGVAGIGSAVFIITQVGRYAKRSTRIVRVNECQNIPDRRESRIDPPPKSYAVSRRYSPHKFALIVVLSAATALWAFAIIQAHGRAEGRYGLLPLLGVPFLVAVALTVAALMFALWFAPTAWPTAVVALGLLLIELNGTRMMFTATPLTSFVYKHFGVVDYIVHGGALNDPLDVYQQWPGFFAAAAWLVRLSAHSPLAYANWATLFFQTLNAVTLFAIARRFSRRRIIPYIAVLLFLTVNWEGEQYYSPQTMAFQLSLLFQFFILSLLEPERLRRPFRYLSWLRMAALNIPEDERANTIRMVRVIGLIALFGAILVTHQLSPWIVFAGVVVLWILGVLRHPPVVLVPAVMLLVYLLSHWEAIGQNPVLNLLDFSNATGLNSSTVEGPVAALGSDLSKVVCVGFWGSTAICALSYRRHLGLVAIPLVLAAVPLSLLLVSSYGGEGIFRAFLFSSPWCALVIAMRVGDLVHAPRLTLVAVGLWSLFAAVASAQSADFGQYPVLQMPAGELRASAYFLDHAPVNSTLVLAADDFPSRLNAKYVLHNAVQLSNDPSLDTYPQFEGNRLERMKPRALAQAVTILAKGTGFLVIAPSMYPAYLDYYQTFAPGTLSSLVTKLKVSNYWKVWYENDGTIIFQAIPHGRLTGK